jgi:uracil-DNA glycosylase family 4
MARLVMGKGPTPCDIVIIGEAPGAKEDEVGEPFVGRAGKLLTEALAAAGIDRDTVYITNVFKHRPPNNRRPTPDEIVSHMQLLAEELHKVQPSYVLLLGNTALSVLGPGDLTISQARGFNLSPDREHATYATFHPSAGLRNPTWKRALFEDIVGFAKIART